MANLKRSNAALKKLLMNPSSSSSTDHEAERAEMRRIVRNLLPLALPVDFEDLARRALASHWNDINPEQRTEFVGAFRALVVRNLSKQLFDQPNYDLWFLNETVTGSEARVDAALEFSSQGRRARAVMECKLLYKGGSWQAYDIIIDQQSMLGNYQAELDKIITKKSFDVVLERMKKRLAKTE